MKLTRLGLKISKSDTNIPKLIAKSTFTTPPNFITKRVDTLRAYKESKEHYYFPKFIDSEINYTNELKQSEINVKSTIQLRKGLQETIYNKLLSQLKTIHGAVLSVPCGVGKTIIGVQSIADINAKTLILVHKDFLMSQWSETIEKYLGVIPGIIKQSDRNVTDITIASIQTLMNHPDFTKTLLFDYLIVDECHHIASKEFSKVLKTLPTTMFTLGLSATPERADNLQGLFYSFLGPLMKFEVPTQLIEIKPIVFYSEIEPVYREIRNNITIDTVSIINSIANYSKRNEFIVKLIEKNVRKHREIMVLSERVSQLNELYTMLSKTMKVSRNYSKYREYSDSNNSVVLASYSMASEGLNITDLDTLILATPIASKTKLIQSVGRIQRSETKSKIVYDIIDPVMEYQYYKRKRIYKTFESKIDEIVETY